MRTHTDTQQPAARPLPVSPASSLRPAWCLPLLALALLTTVLLSAAPGAGAAEFDFCSPGSGAGQCSGPEGVAVDTSSGEPSSGHVYVADRENNRIDVFDSAGTFLFAFGWGVADGANELQTCGPAAASPTASCSAGIAGSGTGQFNKPVGVAVDNVAGSSSRHDLYVATNNNYRIQKFDPEGSFLRMWGWDVVASGPGNSGSGFEVCVPASGDVCKEGVRGGGEGQFSNDPAENSSDSIGIGPGGEVYVRDTVAIDGVHFNNRVEKFEASGAFSETISLAASGIPQAFAVDSNSGDFYFASFPTFSGVLKEGIGRYHPDGTPYGSPYPLDVNPSTVALTVDGSGDLFASQVELAASPGSGTLYALVSKFNAGGEPLRRFAYGTPQAGSGLAAYPSLEAGVFAVQGNSSRVEYIEVPAPGPIVVPPSVEADPVGNAKATLNAEINPEGKETSYQFQYLTQATYQQQGNSFAGPGTVSGPVVSLGSSEPFDLHYAGEVVGCPNPLTEASEPGKCLLAETKYRYRILATNADNPTGSGEASAEGEFETKAPLEVMSSFATGVGIDTARINAEVNPLSVPAGGFFEVVEAPTFEEGESDFSTAKRVPASGELDFGAGEGGAIRGTTLTGLSPGTSYRYRLNVGNPLLAGRILGPVERFTTFLPPTAPGACPANEAFRVGPSALLPDCRAYELVSPLDKEGGNVVVQGEATTGLPAVLEQSSVSNTGEPQRLAYGSYRAFGDAAGAPFTSQYLATRGGNGWQSVGISPPHGRVNAVAGGFDTELKQLSPDLCESWWRTLGEPQLAPKAIIGQPNLYRRSEGQCGTGPAAWEALTTVTPPHAFWALELQGVSADGSAAIFATKDSLPTPAPAPAAQPGGCTTEAETKCLLELYYQSQGEGKPHYVCVLPSGNPVKEGCSAGTGGEEDFNGQNRRNRVHNAISADGSRIYWTAASRGAGKLYLRLNPGLSQGPAGECKANRACALAVSGEAETQAGTSESQYLTAARDGSKAIFSTGIKGANNDRLYEYDLAEEKDHLIAGGLVTGSGDAGVLGASEDASRIYLASEEVLSGANPQGGAPQAGQPNLYLYDSGLPEGSRFHFVMGLAGADATSSFSPIRFQPRFHAARVTPDGLQAAFTSQAKPPAFTSLAKPPSGYDNTDAASGKTDAEVYLYDAAANAGEGKLVCASCNPTGGRPVGVNLAAREGLEFWAAGWLPVWENTLYASRVLSNDGSRLFFESTDRLSPRDSNGSADVYEWQAPGSGSCRESDPDYFAENGGCIELISSGKSGGASRFVDANPSGSDVFIATQQSLLPQDYGLMDIYDAREGGGFPSPPLPPAACEGEACQSPVEAPNDPTPASAAFEGAGNVVKPAARKHAKSKKSKKNKKQAKNAKNQKHKKNHRHGRQSR
jgi:hypothetical protein